MKSSSRDGRRVRLLALHTTEGIRKNSDLRAFFNRADARGSSHASADPSGLMEDGFVPYDRAAWTLRSGNKISENLEQCGWARWSRQEWLGPQMRIIEAAALWVAKRARARDIPIRTLTHAQIRAGEAGVIQHNDWTVAMKDGSHWDCGPGYPIDVVIDLARRINKLPSNPTQPTQPSQPTPTKPEVREDMGVQNFVIPPTTGVAMMRLICPTGSASAITARSWLSMSVVGPRKGSGRVFAQTATGEGIADRWYNMSHSNGGSSRDNWQLPDGTVSIAVHMDMPDGGVVALETEPK